MFTSTSAMRLVVTLAAASGPFTARADSHFLAKGHDLDLKFGQALDEVMGCGSIRAHENLETIQSFLEPMWRVLPKESNGRVGWRLVRYITHRYFMQRSHLLIRGFEPSRSLNASDLDGAGILSEEAPPLLEAMLAKHNSKGFSLQDATTVVATLEQLIFDSETNVLQKAYAKLQKSPQEFLAHKDFVQLMQVYLLHWLIGDDELSVKLLLSNATLREEVIPQWFDLRDFAIGTIKTMEFQRQRVPKVGHAKVAMTQRYSFDDVHEAVGKMTKTFASFWDSECRRVKEKLIDLDTMGSGRVTLADFYGSNYDGNWHFGEAESYLRELGALDETSDALGTQVIIPNYIQGASNCVVGTNHYLVCCVNECEDILNHIEDGMGGSVGTPAEILDIVTNMTDDEDDPIMVSDVLRSQLERIGEIHGGKVPLHGRLHSQWLHYVFPRDCPFPHKAGSVAAVNYLEFGMDHSLAKPDEVRAHAAARNSSTENTTRVKAWSVEEVQQMTQWTEDEELNADYTEQLQAPWELGNNARGSLLVCGCGFAAVSLLLVLSSTWQRAQGGKHVRSPAHSHFV